MGTAHVFPASQAECLRALREGRYGLRRRQPLAERSVSLVDRMPPIYRQSLRGTCVANAVAALLEYHNDCRSRLSVQFLFAATKEVERAGLERNLQALRAGERLDPGFESACHSALVQLRMLADANGGMAADAVRPFVLRFEEDCRSRFDSFDGSLLMSCFRAIETYGVCRHSLWPYSSAPATPIFGSAPAPVVFPPGTREDAAKRRMISGLYLLGAANNVDEVRSILAGSNSRRPMPVAVTVDFFAGCDGELYSFPETREQEDGSLVSVSAWQGRHGLLIVGYVDDESFPGGGYFIIRNSLGEEWGERGYGRMPYAYLECFAVEAGTILQDMVDYVGDGYGGAHSPLPAPAPRRRVSPLLLNLLAATVIIALTWLIAWLCMAR